MTSLTRSTSLGNRSSPPRSNENLQSNQLWTIPTQDKHFETCSTIQDIVYPSECDITIVPMMKTKFWQLNDYLSIGDHQSASNNQLLCRMSVAGLIILSCCDADDGTSSNIDSMTPIPCGCQELERHKRSVLRLNLSRSNLAEMKACFPEMNKFIEGFRRNGRRVLISCQTGDTLCVLSALQYLIDMEELSFQDACQVFVRAGCPLDLSKAAIVLLRSIDSQKTQWREENERNVVSCQMRKAKQAWNN